MEHCEKGCCSTLCDTDMDYHLYKHIPTHFLNDKGETTSTQGTNEYVWYVMENAFTHNVGIETADMKLWTIIDQYNRNKDSSRMGTPKLYGDVEVMGLCNSLSIMCSLQPPFHISMASLNSTEKIGFESAQIRGIEYQGIEPEQDLEEAYNDVNDDASEPDDALPIVDTDGIDTEVDLTGPQIQQLAEGIAEYTENYNSVVRNPRTSRDAFRAMMGGFSWEPFKEHWLDTDEVAVEEDELFESMYRNYDPRPKALKKKNYRRFEKA